MNKQKDRLVELIGSKVCEEYSPNCDEYEPHTCEKCYANFCKVGDLADAILADGWMRPPCKVGDKVYEAIPKGDCIRPLNVVGFHLGKFPDLRGHKRKEYLVCYSDYSLTHVDIDKFGKTVFLSREEAEAKLKEGVQG